MTFSILNFPKLKVYLDDERDSPDASWVRTYTPKSTITLLEAQIVSYLSLDHDLGDDDGIGTGYDVILWLEEQVFTDRYFTIPKTIVVHSANVSARIKMEQGIERIERQNRLNMDWVMECS